MIGPSNVNTAQAGVRHAACGMWGVGVDMGRGRAGAGGMLPVAVAWI